MAQSVQSLKEAEEFLREQEDKEEEEDKKKLDDANFAEVYDNMRLEALDNEVNEGMVAEQAQPEEEKAAEDEVAAGAAAGRALWSGARR